MQIPAWRMQIGIGGQVVRNPGGPPLSNLKEHEVSCVQGCRTRRELGACWTGLTSQVQPEVEGAGHQSPHDGGSAPPLLSPN
jgi:hypothetical protein